MFPPTNHCSHTPPPTHVNVQVSDVLFKVLKIPLPPCAREKRVGKNGKESTHISTKVGTQHACARCRACVRG